MAARFVIYYALFSYHKGRFKQEEETMSEQKVHPETLAVHAGWNGDPATDACAVPVYRTTA